jgi:hypothetical protein
MVVNMALIMTGTAMIPGPEGFDANNMETYNLLEPIHMLMPFLAHALGSLFGAFAASLLSQTRKMRTALIVGAIHMIGGIMMVVQTNAPIYFDIIDLTFAYLPMAVLGVVLGKAVSKK